MLQLIGNAVHKGGEVLAQRRAMLVALSVGLAAGAANAQTSGVDVTAFQSVFTGITGAATTMFGYAVTAATVIWGFYIVFKVGKRLLSKAT